MLSSLRDNALRESNNVVNRPLFPRPHFLNNSNANPSETRFHGKYLTKKKNVTKTVKVKYQRSKFSDENSAPKENITVKSFDRHRKTTATSTLAPLAKLSKKRRRESFSFNTQKTEAKQVAFYVKQMKEEAKKIATKYDLSDELGVEKMRKYVTIKNNTMSPFKKRLLKRNGKASHFDIEEIQSLHETKRKPTATKPPPTRSSSAIFYKKRSTHELANDSDSISLHNSKEVAASYEFKKKLSLILGKKIKVARQKNMEYFETKGDADEPSNDKNDEFYASSSTCSDDGANNLENLRTSSTDESSEDSIIEDYESNNSGSESEQESSFYESDSEPKSINTPQQLSYSSSFSPSDSDDLSSSYTSTSTDGSVYSNSPITLGLFRRDTNGTLQHKVVIKNVQKKAATTLQRFARRCLGRRRMHLCRWAVLCLQTHIRQRQAYQKVKKMKYLRRCVEVVQRYLATKIIRSNFLKKKQAAIIISRSYRSYSCKRNLRNVILAKNKAEEAKKEACKAMQLLQESERRIEPAPTLTNNVFHGVQSLSKTETELQDTFVVSDADCEGEEISMILDVGNESSDISIDITVENALENVLKKIDLKPATIHKNCVDAVANVENRVERMSLGDHTPSISIENFVNEESGFTNYILRIENHFNNLDEINSLSSFALNQSPRKPLMLKRRYSEFFKFDKKLKQHFDKTSYGIPSLPPKTWCRTMDTDFVNRRAIDLNFYIQEISKDEDIVRSKLYKEFLHADCESQ